MRRKYDDTTEMAVVEARLNRVSFRRIFSLYGLHPSSVYQILRRHGIDYHQIGSAKGGREKKAKKGSGSKPGKDGAADPDPAGSVEGVAAGCGVKVLTKEVERRCSCCNRMFKPYVYEYQINRTVCFWCFTEANDDDGNERSCEV